MTTKNFGMIDFEEMVSKGLATWWEMELPSGKVIFGDAKAKMLGYPAKNFKVYQDFTSLLHPDDYESAMNAMRQHMSKKKNFYETIYRIKNKKGDYIKFYDFGQIIKQKREKLTAIGFVMKVSDEEDILKQMKNFKEILLSGKPSMFDLISKIKV